MESSLCIFPPDWLADVCGKMAGMLRNMWSDGFLKKNLFKT